MWFVKQAICDGLVPSANGLTSECGDDCFTMHKSKLPLPSVYMQGAITEELLEKEKEEPNGKDAAKAEPGKKSEENEKNPSGGKASAGSGKENPEAKAEAPNGGEASSGGGKEDSEAAGKSKDGAQAELVGEKVDGGEDAPETPRDADDGKREEVFSDTAEGSHQDTISEGASQQGGGNPGGKGNRKKKSGKKKGRR